MPQVIPVRQAQPVMNSIFEFNFDDTAEDIAGVTKTFGSVFGDLIVMDFMPMPIGATIIGGELIVEDAGVGPTAYTVAVGVAGDAASVLAATDLLVAARTPLLLTSPQVANNGEALRLTISSTVADASAGKFRINVQFVLDNRALENL